MQVLSGLEQREHDYFQIMFLFVLQEKTKKFYPVDFIFAAICHHTGIINDERKNLKSFRKI